jgi:NTE family protein
MKQTDKLQTEDSDLLIKPDLSTFNRLNMNQIDDLIEKGYKDSKKVLKKIF